MKTLRKALQLCSLVLFLLVLNDYAYAQQDDKMVVKELDFLTQNQMLLLKEQQQLIDERKKVFKANLTQDQLSILNDKSISKQRRKEILKKSLTQGQRNNISQLGKQLKTKRDLFKISLTMRQKSHLKRFLSKRNIKDRRRLIRRLRWLIQNNQD